MKHSRGATQGIRIVYWNIRAEDSAMEPGEEQPRIAPPSSKTVQEMMVKHQRVS